MEDTPSWKGHSFTLLVFGGIVVLCSIFFVLGMLVGRSQGQRIAEMNAAEEATKKPPGQPLPESTAFDYPGQTTAAKPDDSFLPEPTAPSAPTTAEGESAAAAPAKPAPEPESVVPKSAKDKRYLQIVATTDMGEADRMLKKVQSKGFKATIMLAKQGSADMRNRVWVGPYDSEVEARMAIKELEAQGFSKPFPVK